MLIVESKIALFLWALFCFLSFFDPGFYSLIIITAILLIFLLSLHPTNTKKSKIFISTIFILFNILFLCKFYIGCCIISLILCVSNIVIEMKGNKK